MRVCDPHYRRYRGLAKTHLQKVANAIALNLDWLAHLFANLPRLSAKPSRLVALISLN